MNLKFSAILLSVLFQGTLYASTLGVVAKINKSGIEAPNTVDDIVNGNKICEDKNTNDNNYPGCDMSTDTGYDEDTDSYDGDMIVRTGDFIELVAGWNITNGSEDVTITSTLPDNANLSWEPLSSLCADGSGIDGRTMTCIRSGYSSATSYSEDMAFLVKVSESNKNDTHTGEFSFKVDSSDADTAEDTTDGNELIITASPRWNLQLFLHQIEKDITVDDKEGYLLTYAFSMEEDEVPDENESGVDGYLGSESLGTDFTLNFTADMSDMSTNAKLVGCLDKDSSYEPLPYPYYIDEYKISTVATLKDDLNIQCSQGDDGNIVVNYSSLDASLNHIPSQSRTQSPYPEDRKVAAVGSIQVFIPYDDVTATDELTDEDGDKYYELRPKLKLRGFDPDSISSTSNFNDGSESLLDNDIETRLDYYPDGKAGGIVMKRFYRPDATVQLAESMVLGDGKGTVTPGDGFRSYLKVLNSGTKDFNNTILCDVIDTNTYNVTKIPGEDTPISVIVQPEDTNWSVEYAVGYVTNAWPNPSPSEDHSADVINECSDSSITWYDNYDDAIANGEVTKVRAVIDTLRPESGKNQFVMTVYHEAKGNDLNGDYLPAKTKLINYMAAHDDALFAKDDNHWHAEYKDMSLETLSRYPEQSDRVLLVRAKARISMDIDNQNAEIGDTREITISPTFTTNNPESNESDDLNISLYFADTLSYIPGSSNYGEPTIVHQYNTYYFKWDLGEHQVNKDVEPLKFNVRVEAKAKNTYYPIYATIISPNADPLPQRHTVDKSINVAVPRALLISKSVDTPFIEQDESMSFITYVQNGADDAITDLDMIDILPFNGDGVDGFNMTIDDTVLHLTRDTTTSPTNYNGTAVFTKAESDYDCSDDVTWYFSDTDPRDMDLSPKHDSNKLDNSGSTNWCQGTVDGPDSSCGFDNSKVTAVRLRRDSSFASSAVCAFRLYMDTDSNKQGDIYTNTTGASADGVTLPVLSNDVSVIVPSTGLGDFVWADTNGNGIQDANESGIDGVTVELLDENDDVVKSVTTDNGGRYSFTSLSPDTEYRVKATLPKDYYRFTTKTQGDDDTKDSDVDTSSGITDIKKLNTNEQYNHFDIGIVSSLTVSGKVYKKDNNETISNIAVSLYLDKNNDNALDDNDKFIAKLDSDANGEYLFTNVFDGDYIVVVDKNDSDIPDNYELVGDDVLDVTVVDKNITNKDFPFLPPNIEPTTDDKLHKVIMNSQEVTLEELTGDDEDGSVVGFIIKSLPSDDQGTLYMSDGTTEVTVNQELTTSEAKDLKFVPKNDYVGDVTFTYSAKDDAGEIDSSPATFKIPVVAPIHIAGTIYDDGNGNGNIDGTVISTIEDNGIFVSLLDENDTLISSLEVEDNGTYDFNGNNIVIPNSKYHLVLTTQESGTIPTLPEDWNNADGENINSKSSTGNDGQENGAGDGKIDVSVVTDSVLQVDFGINKKPVALDQNATAQINPGGDTKVAVPSLKISDNEDSTPSTITITDIPSNATLYYDSVAVNGGDTITNFDNSKLTVDPDNGNQSVIFKYTTTDKAGVTSEIATVEMPFTDIAISGKLFDDGNNNSSVDGNLTSQADDTALYITLVKDGKAVASKELNSGLYEFTSSDGVEANTDYKLVLTDTLNGTTPTLPKTWNNADGEEIGTTGLDATADGQIDISLKEENIKDINFGINKQPLAKDIKESTQVNPGGDTKVAVPSLIISDKEDITPTVVTITELPSNATLYYKGETVTKDSKITDVELDKFTIDPQDGDLNAIFKYTTTDKAGVTSEIATVEMPFNTIEISGHIFNDGNNDGIINGKGISAPNGVQLYVTLISDNGDILASKEVKSDGTYKFTNLDGIEADSKYIIVLSITQNSTTPSLPENWSNLDGEHIGTNAGDDGVNDGKIDVSVANSNVFEVNFGINKKPVAGDNTAPEQLNPGGDVQVTVPDLNISDNEDGTPKVVTIETVPSHGVLYYDGEVVKAGDTFNEFDNTLLRLDPDNGDQVVSFTYTTTDSVGVKSDIATISMSFRGLEISGNIYDDGNNNDKVDGNIISLLDGKQLYATLLNSTGKVLATTTISSNGSYTFDGVDG
ncbi:MAG: hypothetical protein GXO60_04520, partial [Epsilonproteobacteria bacterium]|nr:hypothetical protein [Campylobacterota bacterium]